MRPELELMSQLGTPEQIAVLTLNPFHKRVLSGSPYTGAHLLLIVNNNLITSIMYECVHILL